MNQFPHKPHRSVASTMRVSAPDDRRHFQRFAGIGLVVRLEDRFIEVADISLGGLRLERQEVAKNRVVDLQLLRRDGRKLALNDAVRVEAVVVGSCESWTHLRFSAVTYSLAKMIIRHLAQLNGVQPFIVK